MTEFRAHSADGDEAQAESNWCHIVVGELEKHYPGYRWFVEAGNFAGTATIKLFYPNVLGQISRCGFLIHLSSLKSQSGMRKIMLAGGELLERYGLPRSAAPKDAHLMAREHGLILDGVYR